MQNTGLDSIAKIICSVDLDKNDLAWSDGQFYPVYSNSFGHLLRVVQKKFCTSSDCDYAMVAEKVRDFLNLYQGGTLEQEVTNQLTKLDNKLKLSVKSQEVEKVNKVVQTRVGKTRPGIKSKRTVSSKDEVPGSDIVKKPKIDFDKLFLQYWQLTSSVEDEFKPYLPYTEQSCRCSWIFCPSKTNVNVTSFPKEEYGYIHANTVSLGKGLNFIATIYPYQRTMFWSMVLEHGNSILDVTNENDLERNSVTPYYPQAERQRYVYGKRMEVTCLKKEEVTPVLIKYQLKVKDLERNEVKLIDRFHYIGWEDVCGTNEVELFDVVKNLESYLGQQSVPLVHCMGGVGRTGTALTAFALKALIDTGDIADEESLLGHIQRIILEGRKQRGPEYVQTSTQVETLYKFGLLAFDHKKEQEKKELNKLVEFNC